MIRRLRNFVAGDYALRARLEIGDWGLSSMATIFLVAWVLVMVCVPIVGWTLGDSAMFASITWGLLFQALAVAVIVAEAWGWQKTIFIAAIIAILTYFAEFFGSSTGFPFGNYDYTNLLQPQLNHVPLLIPLAWFMMMPSTWAIVSRLTKSKVGFVLWSALVFTAWDLLLDPHMVDWGFWVWENPHGYFGIPWSNYFGWLLVSGGVSAVILPFITPQTLPYKPLLIIYTITWFLETVGLALFWGLWQPALVGGLIMGIFVYLGWKNLPITQSPNLPK